MTPPHLGGEESGLIETERQTLPPPALETLRIDKASIHRCALQSYLPFNLDDLRAYTTLTRVEYITRNKGFLGGDWIWRSDPYHRLLHDSAFAQLKNLKVLSLKVVLTAEHISSDGLTTRQSFGSQWGPLDTTICPLAPQVSPFPSLRCISTSRVSFSTLGVEKSRGAFRSISC